MWSEGHVYQLPWSENKWLYNGGQ